MHKKARIITQSYHYLNEGMILFFILLFAIQFSTVIEATYWSYLVILLGSSLIFSIFSYKQLHGIFYFILVPLLGFIIYSLQYPLSLVLAFSLLLTYRYWRIEKTEIKRREAAYLGISALLVVVLMVINGDNQIIWLFIIQFLLTFIGYYYSNLALVDRTERNGFRSRFWTLVSGMLITATIAFLFISEFIGRLLELFWQGLSFITIYLSSFFAGLLSWIQADPSIYEGEQEGDDSGFHKSELGESLTQGIEGYAAIAIIIALIIAAIFVVILFLKLRKGPKEKEIEEEKQLYEKKQDKVNFKSSSGGKSWRDYFRKPEHPARRLVFQFEKKLNKTKYARKPYETIEKWLARVGSGTELDVYQRVRYGNQEISEEDLNKLKMELGALEKQLV